MTNRHLEITSGLHCGCECGSAHCYAPLVGCWPSRWACRPQLHWVHLFFLDILDVGSLCSTAQHHWLEASFSCGCGVRHHVWPVPTSSFWQAAGLWHGVKYIDAVLDVHMFGQATHCSSVHLVLGVLGVMKQHALPSAPTVLALGVMCMLVSMHTSGAFAVWFVLLSRLSASDRLLASKVAA
jgi:hypothetical protein